jgi:hypothetical protein
MQSLVVGYESMITRTSHPDGDWRIGGHEASATRAARPRRFPLSAQTALCLNK